MGKEALPGRVVQEIRGKTRRQFSAEEKIRIVLEGLRGEESIATLCRKEGLAPNLYYRWSKEFLEAGKKRLVGDTSREATAPGHRPPGAGSGGLTKATVCPRNRVRYTLWYFSSESYKSAISTTSPTVI